MSEHHAFRLSIVAALALTAVAHGETCIYDSFALDVMW